MHHFDKSHIVISAKETLFTLQEFLMRIGKHIILYNLYIWISEETDIEASPLSLNEYTFWSMLSPLEYCAAKIFECKTYHVTRKSHFQIQFQKYFIAEFMQVHVDFICFKTGATTRFVFWGVSQNIFEQSKRVRSKSALFPSTNKRIITVCLYKLCNYHVWYSFTFEIAINLYI